MLGAIIGDIAGSRYEHVNLKSKDFTLLARHAGFTDDTVLTVAVCDAILSCDGDFTDLSKRAVESLRKFGRMYINAGFSRRTKAWLLSDDPNPCGSSTNGSAMRVSGCAYAASSLEEVKELSRKVTCVTHDHPDGIKGAEAVAVAVYMARTGESIEAIRDYVCRNYYKIDFTLDEIRPTYEFDMTCEGSVPQALEAFFESKSFEDAVRSAVSIGGDSDTIAAITGSIAEPYYGIPDAVRRDVLEFLPTPLRETAEAFERKYPPHII